MTRFGPTSGQGHPADFSPLIHRNSPCSRHATIVRKAHDEEHPMLDVLMIALAFGLFALAIGYTYACERL
jgi:hypothetical protein